MSPLESSTLVNWPVNTPIHSAPQKVSSIECQWMNCTKSENGYLLELDLKFTLRWGNAKSKDGESVKEWIRSNFEQTALTQPFEFTNESITIREFPDKEKASVDYKTTLIIIPNEKVDDFNLKIFNEDHAVKLPDNNPHAGSIFTGVATPRIVPVRVSGIKRPRQTPVRLGEYNGLKEQLQKLQISNAMRRSEMKELERTNENQCKKIKKLKIENDKLYKNIEHVEDEKSLLVERNVTLANRVKLLVQENNSQELQINSLKMQLSSLNTRVDLLEHKDHFQTPFDSLNIQSTSPVPEIKSLSKQEAESFEPQDVLLIDEKLEKMLEDADL